MLELFLIACCIVAFLYSFLYRRLSILIIISVIFCTYILDENIYLILGVSSILILIRLKLNGIKEEY